MMFSNIGKEYMMFVDMHAHSHYSDGADSPRDLVRKAKEAGLFAICLTDHDAFEGLPEFVEALEEFNMNGLPGVEVSATWRGAKVHILGYGIDYTQSYLFAALMGNRQGLRARATRSLELYREAGIMDVSMEEIQRVTGHQAPLAHELWIRDYRMKVFGINKEEATAELRPGGVAYAEADHTVIMSPTQAVRLIKKLGGLAVWAHPGQFIGQTGTHEFSLLAAELKDAGLDGMEVYHPTHAPKVCAGIYATVLGFGMFHTGGSDYHGRHKLNQLGDMGITQEEFVDITTRL